VLDQNVKSQSIVDQLTILTIKGVCFLHCRWYTLRFCVARLLSKQNSPEANEAWRTLISHNPDSSDFYRGYLANEGLSAGMVLTFV